MSDADEAPQPGSADPPAPLPRREDLDERRWILMPLVVLGLGLMSIALLVLTNWIRERLVIEDTALHRAVGEMQTRLSGAHLWLEEYVTGDDVDLDEVFVSFERAESLARAMLEGGGQTGPYSLKAVTDPDLERRLAEIRPQIEQLHALSIERERGFRRGAEVGVGSPIDVRYDRIYNQLLGDLRQLDVVVGERLDRAHARSQLLFQIILIAWVVIVAVAVTGLARLEMRHRRAERALRESEAQLRQSQKMEAVGRLAGGMAHDINNYLAAIRAQCELVLMTSKTETPLHQRMERVLSTTAKAGALIERLLAFSRRKPVQPEVLNVNEVVAQMSELLERLIGEDIQLETRLAEDLWNIELDPSQMEQVIMNLVVNAREAMPTGGRLLIETTNQRVRGEFMEPVPVEREGDYVVLSVSDSGIGVPTDLREKIFEPFVTTKEKTRQSGLGLAMVYSITRQAGGGVKLYSEEGQGAVFKVFLPRSRAIPVPDAEEVEGREPMRGAEQRLLLVEDNEDLRDAASEALRKFGYRVSVASSAEEALALAGELDAPPELLITDVVMPGMNGRELWEALRQRFGPLEVIFISGYTDDVVLRHGVEEGEYRFIQKPFSVETLAVAVASVFEEAAPSAADRS